MSRAGRRFEAVAEGTERDVCTETFRPTNPNLYEGYVRIDGEMCGKGLHHQRMPKQGSRIGTPERVEERSAPHPPNPGDALGHKVSISLTRAPMLWKTEGPQMTGQLELRQRPVRNQAQPSLVSSKCPVNGIPVSSGHKAAIRKQAQSTKGTLHFVLQFSSHFPHIFLAFSV